jgi:hypothetical protein
MKRTVNIKRTIFAGLLAMMLGLAASAPTFAFEGHDQTTRIVPTFDGKSGTETHGRGKDGNETHGRTFGKDGNETHG